jgi:methionyl-tRNA formyltransferase
MDEGMDTGAIIAQRATPIRPDDTGGSLTDRLALLGAATLVESLPAYLSGEARPRPQNAEQVTKAPRLRKEDGLLDPMTPAELLARRVRAYQPWPGAFMPFAASILKVLRAHVVDAFLPPGNRAVLDGQPAWGTIKGVLVLDEVQPPGRKPMRGDEFIMGARHWMS